MAEYDPTTPKKPTRVLTGRVALPYLAKKAGFTWEGEAECFGVLFQASHPVCSRCPEADRCEQFILEEQGKAIAGVAVQPERPKREVLTLPDEFLPLHKQILSLTPKIACYSSTNMIKYKYAMSRFLNILGPRRGGSSPSDFLTMVFLNFKLADFKDPKQAMFVGISGYEKFPAMFVRPGEQDYAISIIKQALKRHEAKLRMLAKGETRGKRSIPKEGK